MDDWPEESDTADECSEGVVRDVVRERRAPGVGRDRRRRRRQGAMVGLLAVYVVAVPLVLLALHRGVPWAAAVVTTGIALVAVAGIGLVTVLAVQQHGWLAELRTAEERFHVAFDDAPIGMALLGRDGRWLQVNRALADLTGYREVELLATSLLSVTHPEDREGDRSRLEDLLDGRRTDYRYEKRLIRQDGSTAWVRATGSPVRDVQGKVRYVVAQYEDITDRRRTEAVLNHRVLHDPLTGLANRILLMDRLGHALAVRERTGRRPALMFVDLDRFKVVNDGLGHDIGDQILVEVALRLQRELRPGDTAARLGGDEFVILCEDLEDQAVILMLAHRLLDVIRQPIEVRGQHVEVTASIGVVQASDDEDRVEALLRGADTAMYRAKERGRARVELFDEDMRHQTAERVRLESELRRALEEHQIQVVYQPTIDLRTGTLEGVEALARWEHPTLGSVGTEAFMGIAEDSGLIVPIGLWVLNEACRQAAVWRAAGRSLTVGVNLSARQLNRPGLAALVEAVLAEHRLPPSALRLEITESVLVEAGVATVVELTRLRDIGVSLGIDDFGTGYSSMSYLKRFPVDFIKIDRSFVAGLGVDREDTAIVQATLALGKALGLSVIAEGIETSGQASRLAALGCQFAQGYLYGRPQPAATALSRALQPVA